MDKWFEFKSANNILVAIGTTEQAERFLRRLNDQAYANEKRHRMACEGDRFQDLDGVALFYEGYRLRELSPEESAEEQAHLEEHGFREIGKRHVNID